MRNKNKTVWSHRIGKVNSKNFQRIGSSINVDKRLYNEDIWASIIHVQLMPEYLHYKVSYQHGLTIQFFENF